MCILNLCGAPLTTGYFIAWTEPKSKIVGVSHWFEIVYVFYVVWLVCVYSFPSVAYFFGGKSIFVRVPSMPSPPWTIPSSIRYTLICDSWSLAIGHIVPQAECSFTLIFFATDFSSKSNFLSRFHCLFIPPPFRLPILVGAFNFYYS